MNRTDVYNVLQSVTNTVGRLQRRIDGFESMLDQLSPTVIEHRLNAAESEIDTNHHSLQQIMSTVNHAEG